MVRIQDVLFLLVGLALVCTGLTLIFDLKGFATKFRRVALYRRPNLTLVPAGLTLCLLGLFLVVSAIVNPV